MKKIFLSLAAVMLIAGCGNGNITVGREIFVANINGKPLYRLAVKEAWENTHYVYFFKGDASQPLTINYSLGKQGNKAIISINGVPVSTNELEKLQ